MIQRLPRDRPENRAVSQVSSSCRCNLIDIAAATNKLVCLPELSERVEFIPSRVARALFRPGSLNFGQPLCLSVCLSVRPSVRPLFQPFRRSRARESPARPQTANQSLTTAARCRGWARMRAGNGRTRFKTHSKFTFRALLSDFSDPRTEVN